MIEQFLEAVMNATGGAPSLSGITPGKLIRFATSDKRGDESGWCKLFVDGEGGVLGCWRQGITETWQAQKGAATTPEQRAAYAEKVKQARAEAARFEAEQRAECRKQSAELWDKGRDVDAQHPYIVAKQIKPYGVRQSKESLLVPVRDSAGTLHGLQFIQADGSKKFKTGTAVTGCYHAIGKPKGKLLIAEGYATAAALHEITGLAVACAFNAGNLEAVAEALRAKLPDTTLILCADDDHATEGNPGLKAATEAARAVNGLLAIPAFPESRGSKDSDFQDMAKLTTPEAVRACIDSAAIVTPTPQAETPIETNLQGQEAEAWPEPLPMASKVEPEEYPLDALPDVICKAVTEVGGFVKAPVALVACTAIAALSVAVQAHADVERAQKLTGPSGLFLLSIADSGERKTTCDGFFTQAIREYEAQQEQAAKPLMKDYEAAVSVWTAKTSGVKDAIRQLAKNGTDPTDEEKKLIDLEHEKPEPPRYPVLMYADSTPEALKWDLAKKWPSAGVVSSEGGVVFGAHGMQSDSVTRNLATLNQLWDGKDIQTGRRSSESFTVRGARLTVAVQIQEAALRDFLTKTGALARGTGFLARFLIAWPESTQGSRPFTEAPDQWPHLAAFNKRMTEILEQTTSIDDDGCLHPALLTLAPEAKAAWIEFHNAIESELVTGGELYDVRDVASKTADNAARIAALFQVFIYGGGAIGLDVFQSAERIAAWHLNESRRFFGELALPPEMADAARLDTWLVNYCNREKTGTIPIAVVQQYAPYGLRKKAAIDSAVDELELLHRARPAKQGKRHYIEVNPALFGGHTPC